jgi:uncharacterized membrane protein YdbT with pleckstrin-like domain
MEYHGRIAWRGLIGYIILALVLLAGGIYLWSRVEALGIALVILAGVTLVAMLYRRLSSRYHIREGRIEHREGFIAKNVSSIRARNIREINLKQNVFQRILNFGDIEFNSAGSDHVEVRFKNIARPQKLKDRVETELQSD